MVGRSLNALDGRDSAQVGKMTLEVAKEEIEFTNPEVSNGQAEVHSVVAHVGPYEIRRSDGFQSPWAPGTTANEIASLVKSAIQLGIQLNSKIK